MRRNLAGLTLAVLLAGPAAAVMVDDSGRGEVLLLPYYTVQAGHQTLLSIVNHSNAGKAVKVRFREARNGREALSFNLYLGEFDVWTAAVYADGESGARLLTRDNSCTVPAIKGNALLPTLPDGTRYVPFSTFDFSGPRSDGGSTDASRTREGYVEIIEMGQLANNSDSDRAATALDGVPQGCASLVQAWAPGGYWRADPAVDLQPPGGGLSASSSILQVADGTMYTAPATALSRFSIVVQHGAPEAALPDLSSAVTETARQKVESIVLDQGKVHRSYWPQERAIDAVTAALMREQFDNEFEVDPAIRAQTQWVFAMPTRRHYFDPVLAPVATPPFTSERPSASTAQSCFGYKLDDLRVFNREQARPVGSINFITVPGFDISFCQAAQVLSLNASRMLGSATFVSFGTQFSGTFFPNGHFSLQLSGSNHRTRPALGGEQYDGLPLIGYRVTAFRNNAARPGELGIYSTAVPHTGTVACVRDGAPCSGI